MLDGVILKGIGGFYYVRDLNGTVYELKAKGRFRRERITPIVGDNVQFEPGNRDTDGWIENILPRKSVLIRPAVANIQNIVLVIASKPQPDWMLMDTLLIMAFRQGIHPIFVLNKCDEPGADELFSMLKHDYAALSCPFLKVSAVRGDGIQELTDRLREGIFCFAGQSGVGKSTLIARITGINVETGSISERISRGKHTTRHVELLCKDGFQILDTPGFSLLELSCLPNETEPITLKEYYPDFLPYEGKCRFSPCYHLSEPGCAVLSACKEGKISSNRLERYHILLKKAQEDWKKRYD